MKSKKQLTFRPRWNDDLKPLITELRKFSKPVQTQCLSAAIKYAKKGGEIEIDHTKNKKTITSPKSSRIKTLDDLIRVCKIDTSVWNVDRYVVNKWEVGSQVDGQIIVEPLFQIKAWLKKSTEIFELKRIRQEIIEDVKSFAPKYEALKFKNKNHGQLMEVNIFDLHFGKLCWGKETGDNYDIKIATKRFIDAISAMIERSKGFDIKRVVFPIGNDFFNSDTRMNQTSNGTPQDEDLRWQKTYRAGRQLLIKGIDMLSQIAPVDVVVVQGNHDFERSFYVGDAMECWYHNNKNVKVNNGANPRKHYKFGKCLITYTHGNNEKVADLPLLVASEEPKLWSETKFREIHVGHLHHKKEIKFMATQEHKGMVIRFMRSLSGTDAWHNLKGYKGGIQSCEMFIWDENDGLVCQFAHNI
jgi:predicted phosphodiesterase